MKRRRKRKCHNCKKAFLPSAQNVQKQCYCGAAVCKKASARKANKRWRAKNPDHHTGSEAIMRVQEWRAAHPGYWRRKAEPLEPNALQDDCIAQVVDDQEESASLERFALQDDCIVQSPVLLGLISTLTGSALQDDIAVTCRGLHKQGRRILDARSGIFATIHHTESYAKTSSRFKTPPPGSDSVQLGRSPLGAGTPP